MRMHQLVFIYGNREDVIILYTNRYYEKISCKTTENVDLIKKKFKLYLFKKNCKLNI